MKGIFAERWILTNDSKNGNCVPLDKTEPIECLLQKANGPSYELYENEQMTVTGKRINVYGVPGNIEPSALPLVVESFWTPRFNLRIIG